MLHMVLLTHGPDSCPGVHAEVGEKARNAAAQIAEAARRLEAEPKGWWLDPSGHIQFLLIDAPSAHAVDLLARQLQLFHWNTVDIHPVLTMEEAGAFLAR